LTVSFLFHGDLFFPGWDCLPRSEDEGGHLDPPHGWLVRGHYVHRGQPQCRSHEKEAGGGGDLKIRYKSKLNCASYGEFPLESHSTLFVFLMKKVSLNFDFQAASYQPAFKRSTYGEPDDDTQCRLFPYIFSTALAVLFTLVDSGIDVYSI